MPTPALISPWFSRCRLARSKVPVVELLRESGLGRALRTVLDTCGSLSLPPLLATWAHFLHSGQVCRTGQAVQLFHLYSGTDGR
uniref:Uncharacterized protein n=1 Tax=Solibacter usitatus (strain Ellin6076) TaxID=234267 RepID=Q022W6_SOLUE